MFIAFEYMKRERLRHEYNIIVVSTTELISATERQHATKAIQKITQF